MTKRQQIRRINTRGPRRGECNICGENGPLTEDHTPPKSCRGIAAAELQSLHARLSFEEHRTTAPRRFQGGVHFRTLCARCNELLGRRCDPALARFGDQVRTIANSSSLHLPAVMPVEIAPQAVMRSVLGHLAAQGVGRYRKGPITEPLRDYILDFSLPLPQQIRIYYWLYPHRAQVLIRDAVMGRVNTDVTVLFWLLKFFPLAFLVTFDEPPERQFQPFNLDTFRDVGIDSHRRIFVQLRPLMHPRWPEAPDDHRFILYGEQSLVADPLTRIIET
jgi:hypothetical protein